MDDGGHPVFARNKPLKHQNEEGGQVHVQVDDSQLTKKYTRFPLGPAIGKD